MGQEEVIQVLLESNEPVPARDIAKQLQQDIHLVARALYCLRKHKEVRWAEMLDDLIDGKRTTVYWLSIEQKKVYDEKGK